MKILYLCSKDYWDHKMSRVRFHGIDAIGRHSDVELIKSGPGWEGFTDCKSAQDKYSPDLIVWYKPLGMPGYESVTVPTCIRYNEMWDIKWTTEEILKSKSKLVICHHENDIGNFHHITTAKFFNIPHCAEKTIFKDYKQNKDIDIQLIGIIGLEFYPLRYRIKKLIEDIMVPSLNVKFNLLTHPGYHISDVNNQVIRYAMQLNRAKINITCSSKYKYALAKYSEVPMCNSLLAADIPEENKAWYSEWMCEIDNSYSDEKIINTLYSHLSNEDLLKEKTKKGYEYNLRERTQENYANNFVDIVKRFL